MVRVVRGVHRNPLARCTPSEWADLKNGDEPDGIEGYVLYGFAHHDFQVGTDRFNVRTLKASDVGEAYATWFDDPVVQQFIAWRPAEDPVKELREFVAGHEARADSLLLGIFDAEGRHVANLKYEPIDLGQQTAVLGVLIGDAAWRGRGLFGEVFSTTAELLHGRFGIRRILLGVDGENAVALAAYERAGFVAVPRSDGGPVWMECLLG